MAQVLRVLNKATCELEDYYSKLKLMPSHTPKARGLLHRGSYAPPVLSHPITPSVAPPSFREYSVEGEEYKVEYISRFGGSFFPSRMVFKGTVMCRRDEVKHDVVIKFAAT